MSKSSSASRAPIPVRVLWLEDQPRSVEDTRDTIYAEQKQLGLNRLEIEIATSVPEARSNLVSGNYAAFVADLNMEYSKDPDGNGAKLLHEINQREKFFPTFVCSSYIGQEPYRKYLDQSHPINVIHKGITTFERPVLEHPFFKQIYDSGRSYVEVKQYEPEKIAYEDFLKEPEKCANSPKSAQSHRNRPEEIMRKG